MNQQIDDTTPRRKRLEQGWKLAALLTLTAGLAGAAGTALANGQAIHAMHADMHADPAAMAKHFDEMIAEVLPDATPQQKARLKEIVTSVHADMRGVHGGLGQAHTQLLDLFVQPEVDRGAFEAVAAGQARQIDAAANRIARSLADAAAVLTPAQRVKIAEHLKMHMHGSAQTH